MASKNLDDTWVKYPLFILLPIYGFIVGWAFGPIFFPLPWPTTANTDPTVYSGQQTLDAYANGHLYRSYVPAAVCFVVGILLAWAIWYKLNKQADQLAAEQASSAHAHEGH